MKTPIPSNRLTDGKTIQTSRQRISAGAAAFISGNRAALILCVAILLSGGACGGIIYSYLSVDVKNQIFTYMQNYFLGSVILGAAPTEIFKSVFLEHIYTAVIIMLGGLFPFLYPLCFVRLFSKGLSMGFSITFLIARYGTKGAAFSLASVLLCNIITLASTIWFIAEVSAIRKNIRVPRSRKLLTRVLPDMNGAYRIIICTVIFIAASLISSIFESVIGHGLLKSLYGIFSSFL